MSRMLEEIREQPDTLERTLNAALLQVEPIRARFAQHRPRAIVLAARGTSDNAAQFGRYLLEITTGIPVSLAAPSAITLYQSPLAYSDALVIALSQSGESTDTNLVLEYARQQGALTIGITNEAGSSLAKLAELVLLVQAGKERSIAATKTYTGQMMVCYLLAWALGSPLELDDLREIPAAVAAALALESQIAERAERYTFMTQAVAVARGLNYSNALEFALKLMETSYVVAERFSAADLLHGPIAMIERHFPAFLFAPSGVTWPGMKLLIEKLNGLKAETLLITDLSNREALEAYPRSLALPLKLAHKGPLPEDHYTAIPYIVPAQLFAASLATLKGLDPDRPRTLSKVTLTV